MARVKGFQSELASRFLLRHHMAAILLFAVAGGVLANKILMHSGIFPVLVRYPLCVIVSFVAFVFAMRSWLSYLTRVIPPSKRTIRFDDEECNSEHGTDQTRQRAESSALDLADIRVFELVPDDLCGCLLFTVFTMIVSIGGSAFLLIYEAPSILAEVAFQFFLVAGLIRSARKIDSPNWVGSVVARTWKPFAVVLAASLFFGIFAELCCRNPTGILQIIESFGK